jgi:hypothetical protein
MHKLCILDYTVSAVTSSCCSIRPVDKPWASWEGAVVHRTVCTFGTPLSRFESGENGVRHAGRDREMRSQMPPCYGPGPHSSARRIPAPDPDDQECMWNLRLNTCRCAQTIMFNFVPV